ncbi:MAG: diacylglycerol kinase [Luminiphilus sp.]|nr:diacylglycerol kinase [Luminiphilus sp.]RZO80719.1 MAG: diacylglycerol kinase [Halieaceae bacterium]
MTADQDRDTGEVVRRTGLRRLLFTLVNSGKGLRFLLRKEEAFQLEALLACVLIPVAILLPVSPVERLLLIGAVFTVLIVEVLNTSIEVLTDRVSLDRHQLSGLAKDLGSLAVTLSLLLWAIVWGVIVPNYWPFAM